jgi:hypothetical protein
LKVASDKKFGQHFRYHSTYCIASPFQNGTNVVCLVADCIFSLLVIYLWKCRYRERVYWSLLYPLSILKVIFLESNPLWFIENLISFIRAYVYICPTNIWSVPVHFNEFWIANIRIYEHIWYENYDFMSQKWKKINQKFVLLKVASDKKFGQILRSIELFIYIQTCVNVNAYPIKK